VVASQQNFTCGHVLSFAILSLQPLEATAEEDCGVGGTDLELRKMSISHEVTDLDNLTSCS
jgi:hypothetical protein